jgi:predicted DNA-binding transcriptional regulator YafY
MRAERLLQILLHLQVKQRVTAHALAALLSVSERTVRRDLEALCAAGVPLTSEGGVGGWELMEHYETRLNGLNDTPKGLRIFRVSRIKHAGLLAETFEWPEGFDLAQSWQQARKAFKDGRDWASLSQPGLKVRAFLSNIP